MSLFEYHYAEILTLLSGRASYTDQNQSRSIIPVTHSGEPDFSGLARYGVHADGYCCNHADIGHRQDVNDMLGDLALAGAEDTMCRKNLAVGITVVHAPTGKLVYVGGNNATSLLNDSYHSEFYAYKLLDETNRDLKALHGIDDEIIRPEELISVVTHEPCPMCTDASLQYGIGQTYYISFDKAGGLAAKFALDGLPDYWADHLREGFSKLNVSDHIQTEIGNMFGISAGVRQTEMQHIWSSLPYLPRNSRPRVTYIIDDKGAPYYIDNETRNPVYPKLSGKNGEAKMLYCCMDDNGCEVRRTPNAPAPYAHRLDDELKIKHYLDQTATSMSLASGGMPEAGLLATYNEPKHGTVVLIGGDRRNGGRGPYYMTNAMSLAQAYRDIVTMHEYLPEHLRLPRQSRLGAVLTHSPTPMGAQRFLPFAKVSFMRGRTDGLCVGENQTLYPDLYRSRIMETIQDLPIGMSTYNFENGRPEDKEINLSS